MKNKITTFICVLLSFVMAMSLCGVSASEVEAEPLDDLFLKPIVRQQEVPAGYTGIYTARDLSAMENGNYILMNDIDLSEWGSWQPIRPQGQPFQGILDGNGYVIHGLSIQCEPEQQGAYGLFSAVSGAEIRNLGLSEINITALPKAEIAVGGLAGGLYGIAAVENCFVTGVIEVTSNADFSASSVLAGGFFGYANAMHVSDCRSNVRVSARTKQAVYAGGLAGKAAAFDVDKLDTNYVTDCVNEGQITAHSADAQAVNEHAKPYFAAAGGLIGYAEGTYLKGCENRGLITTKTELSLEKEIDTLPSTSTAGGLVGYFDGGAIENGRNLSGVQAQVRSERSGKGCAGGIVGSSDNPAGRYEKRIDQCQNFGEVKVDSMLVRQQEDLLQSAYAGGVIGLAEYVTIERSSNAGRVLNGPDPQTPEKPTAAYVSNLYAGGIAGCAFRVSLYSSYNAGQVVSYDIAGGILGYGAGAEYEANDLQNCYNQGQVVLDVSGSKNAYAFSGGLAGILRNMAISSCYNTGALKVIGKSDKTKWGALFGSVYTSSLTTCYYLQQVSEGAPVAAIGDDNSDDAGCTGLSSDAVRKKESYKGFNFFTYWAFDETKNDSQPYLTDFILREHELPFTDVSESKWYYLDIEAVYRKGLMSGVSSVSFLPETGLTRGMLASVLWHMEGRPVSEGTPGFTDLTQPWYRAAIGWASEAGIVYGYSSARFGPDDLITREQLAAIFYRYAKYKEIPMPALSDIQHFNDVADISSYAEPAMQWAYTVKLISGRTHETLVPKGTATRAETAAIFNRYLSLFVS